MARSPAAERGLNDLIERRATERESANTAADLWKRDEAKYRAGLKFSRMKEWQEHYLQQVSVDMTRIRMMHICGLDEGPA